MATDVIMPQMGESIAEGTITKWLVNVGDSVDRDQPLLEISTDKVDAEIPSPAAGVLLEIKYEEGVTVGVNELIAVIGEAGEALGEVSGATVSDDSGDSDDSDDSAESELESTGSSNDGESAEADETPEEAVARLWLALNK